MLRTGDRVYAFHENTMKRARVVSLEQDFGAVIVSFPDKSTGVVSPNEIAPLYRWENVEMDGEKVGERFLPLFEVNGILPPTE